MLVFSIMLKLIYYAFKYTSPQTTMMKSLFFILIVSIAFTACKQEGIGLENGNNQMLQKTWVNSVEEQATSEELIYRPENYRDFPVLMYRHQYVFNSGGKVKIFVLAQNDGHYFAPCTWAYNAGTHILEIKQDGEERPTQFLVTALENDLLKLKRL